MSSYHCLFNDDILPRDEIRMNVGDLSLIRGYGVFDFLRTYKGVPFRIHDYLDRFDLSSTAMHLTIPYDRKELIEKVNELLEKNKMITSGDVGMRFILTGGYALDGYTIEQPNFFILVEELPVYPEWHFTEGIRLNLWEHQRELPLVKTINYLTAIQLTRIRQQLDVQDTLYHFNNKILECTRNNFFLMHGNTLVTADTNVLKGITAKVVLEIAKGQFNIETREVDLNELENCTECFITGSTRGVCPVAEVDGKSMGKRKQGNNTKKLMQLFQEQWR